MVLKVFLTVSVLSKHCSCPGSTGQPDGPQSWKGTFLQLDSGVYFLTTLVSSVHFIIGHFVHSSLVE